MGKTKQALVYLQEPSFEVYTPLDEWKDGIMHLIERCIRVCYKSERKIKQGSDEEIIRKIIDSEHDSTLEHFGITVNVICSRYTSHQLVRHRIGHGDICEEECTFGFSVPSVSQESQRWCNYKNKGFVFVLPPGEFDDLGLGLYKRATACDNVFILDKTGATGESNGAFHNKTHYYSDMTLHPDLNPTEISKASRIWLNGRFNDVEEYLALMAQGKRPEIARTALGTASKTEVVCTYNIRQWREIFRQRTFNPHAQAEIRSIMTGVWNEFYHYLPVLFGDLADV